MARIEAAGAPVFWKPAVPAWLASSFGPVSVKIICGESGFSSSGSTSALLAVRQVLTP